MAVPHRSRSRPAPPARFAGLLAATTALTLLLSPAAATAGAPASGAVAGGPPGAGAATSPSPRPLPDLDRRGDRPAPAPDQAQRRTAAALDATVRWGPFGTPQSVLGHEGYLGPAVDAGRPAAAARAWLAANDPLYRLSGTSGSGLRHELRLHAEVPLTDEAYAVVFRQYVDGRPVAPEGLATFGVRGSAQAGWQVAYASGVLLPPASLAAPAPPAGAPGPLTAQAAVRSAVADTGDAPPERGELSAAGPRGEWQAFTMTGNPFASLARAVAFPLPDGEVRPAFETVSGDGTDGYRHIVDARTGAVWYRESLGDGAVDSAEWQVYPARPPMTRLGLPPWGYPDADRRTVWCWTEGPGCEQAQRNDAARVAWDVDARTGEPTFTTSGNAVTAAEWWDAAGAGPGRQPVSPQRSYRFPWTNGWYAGGCDSGDLTGDGNDIDAAVTNLFATGSRLHAWAYQLGFTEQTWNAQAHNFGSNPDGEGDPVIARAQAGAVDPGLRNNATMFTRPDGSSPVMSMFLWQPSAGEFYGPCALGDMDSSVIAHEYTHMIENRLIGKGGNRSGFHAGAMGESFADFIGLEYHHQHDLLPGGSGGWAVGAYVTGNPVRGIRSYNMSFPAAGRFPEPGTDARVGALHFGSMGYDIVGPQVHADSQIWSATNHDLRELFLGRYPDVGADRQAECAAGDLPVTDCPGNRRWLQLVFDAMLLMPTEPTMLDARDAYLAADLLRTGGEDRDLLWQGFARRGFGAHASVTGPGDTDPVPSYESPLHEPATLRFVAVDQAGQPVDAAVFAGDFEARATPLRSVERFLPHPEGYNFVARAEGHGHVRFFVSGLDEGETRTVTIHFPTNVASEALGATAAGDGTGHAALLDETEATNWESADRPVGGAQVVVALPGERSFTSARVSGMLLPEQSRFTAVRQFELYACTAGDPDNPTCAGGSEAGWHRVLRSGRDAFPAPNPRPSAPDLLLRRFPVPETTATHVKLVVLHNQCTGYRGYHGPQHADPAVPDPDCRTDPVAAEQVRVASLQLLTGQPRVQGADRVG